MKTIIGIFDGEHLLSEEGKRYPVPGNYASKSMLVEGDELKLTIDEGNFIYKQLVPMERSKFIGKIVEENKRKKVMNENGKTFSVLSATLNYYELELDDEVVAVVPKEKDSHYAAVEMVTNR